MSPDIGNEETASRVARAFRDLDPSGHRFGRLLRDTLDQVYDGVHTGRYRWDQLRGAERLHFGPILAINLQRTFNLDDSVDADFKIAGVDVGVVFDPLVHEWTVPARLLGKPCVGVTADDAQARWAACVFRADLTTLEEHSQGAWRPTPGLFRSADWLWDEGPLPPNVLALLPDDEVELILDAGGRGGSGQARVDELFRQVRERRIGRAVVATVARQVDYMRRVRRNGGARTNLRPEGIVILGQYESHQRLARQLGLPVPEDGEFVSTRLVLDPKQGVEIDGGMWRRARPDDPVVTAPLLPPT